jgi:hypothetical protein
MAYRLTLFFILFSFYSFAQVPINVNRSPSSVIANDYFIRGTHGLGIPVVSDTAHGLGSNIDSLGLLIYSKADSSVFVRDTLTGGGHKWTKVGAGSGGGSTDTTSLSNRINTKKDKVDSVSLAGYSTNANRLKLADSLTAIFNSLFKLSTDSVRLSGYTTVANKNKLADSLTANFNALIGSYKLANDSVRLSGFTTIANKNKLADSLTANFNALLTLYKLKSDSVALGGYTTVAHANKIADSLRAVFNTLLLGKVDTGSRANIYFQKDGARGIMIGRGHDSVMAFKGLVDSGAFHLFLNPDSTITGYVDPGAAAYDSALSQGGGFHTDGFNQGKYVQIKDSTSYATFKRLYKTMDSLGAIILKKGDSTQYATFGRLYKTMDSLNLVMLHKGDSAGVGYTTLARTRKVIDSLGAIIAAGTVVKTSLSVTGTGVTGDSVRLVNDARTPVRGSAYMTRPGADSAKGYYEIEENSFGFLYKKGTWADATTGFVNKGTLSVAATAGKLVVTGGATDYSKALLIDAPSMLDKWESGMAFTVGTKSATATDGPAVGKYSLNAYNGTSAVNLTVKFLMNSGANSGQIVLNGYLGVQLAISPLALSFSISDSISLHIDRDGYYVVGTARNVTTNSAPIKVYYFFSTYLPESPQTIDNTGDYAVFGLGGNFTVDTLYAFTKYPTNARGMVLCDSKGQGYYATNQSDRFIDQLNARIHTVINHSGGSDRLREVAMCLPEIYAFRPQWVWNLAGSNSVRHGDDSTTYCTLYDSINTALRAHGIYVYTGVLYETSIDMSKLWNHIQQVESSATIIDVYNPGKIAGFLTSDFIHITSFGDSVVANTAFKSGKLYAVNERYGEDHNFFVRNQYRNAQTADYNITGNATANSYTAGNTKIVRGATTEGSGYAVLGTTNGSAGFLQLADSAGGTDAKRFDIVGFSNHIYLRTLNDAANSAVNALDITRSGTTVSNIKFNSGVTINQATGVPLTFTPLANGDGLTGNFTITGFTRPIVLYGSATAGLQMFMSNTSTNSGAYCNVFLTTASSAAGSPTFAVQNAGTGRQYYWGLNRNTDDWQLQTGGNFFSEWGGTSIGLLIAKPTGEIGIGGTRPVASSQLMMTSTTQGFLPPRMTTTQMNAISSPATGLVIWNSDSLNLCVYNATAWRQVSYTSAVGASQPFTDATAIVKNSSDPTKLFRPDASGISSGTTVVETIPNYSYTPASLGHAQTFTGVNTFTAGGLFVNSSDIELNSGSAASIFVSPVDVSIAGAVDYSSVSFTSSFSISTSTATYSGSFITCGATASVSTITLPSSGASGRTYKIINANTSSGSWAFAGTVLKDALGNTITSFPTGYTYEIFFNGSTWDVKSISYIGSGRTGIPAAGSYSSVGTATTTFTVTIGITEPNSTYKVNVTPTDVLGAALFYVNNKTATTFDVVYLSGLTGTVSFDWVVTP